MNQPLQVQRREELKMLLQQHIVGTLPPSGMLTVKPPTVVNATACGPSTPLCEASVNLTFTANGTDISFVVALVWSGAASTKLVSPFSLISHAFSHTRCPLVATLTAYAPVHCFERGILPHDWAAERSALTKILVAKVKIGGGDRIHALHCHYQAGAAGPHPVEPSRMGRGGGHPRVCRSHVPGI
jgi:hypothetical protein